MLLSGVVALVYRRLIVAMELKAIAWPRAVTDALGVPSRALEL